MNDIKTLVLPTNWLPKDMPHGWGNGYVGVPPGHPWFGKGYNDIDCSVHGGLTYGEHKAPTFEPDGYYWVGFDCHHRGDDEHNCPESYVRAEVESLRKQAEKAVDNVVFES